MTTILAKLLASQSISDADAITMIAATAYDGGPVFNFVGWMLLLGGLAERRGGNLNSPEWWKHVSDLMNECGFRLVRTKP